MFDFPLPYQNELLYSTIARYQVHQGIISPKELLDVVYNDRKVVATVDLPSHIEKISSLYLMRDRLSSVDLIYSHTLFPLYAPFVDEHRRKKCIEYMQGQVKSSVHLTLGIAASKVKQPRWLRYCPSCLIEQKSKFGEYYWLRNWQVAGADSCLRHGRLVNSEVHRHPVHKHLYTAATHHFCHLSTVQQPSDIQADLITQSVNELLEMPPIVSPTIEQWDHFYRSLLFDHSLNRSRHINYRLLKEKVVNFFSSQRLKKYHLYPEEEEKSWLKAIFRKHRKTFSYLEHLVVWHSLLKEGWQVSNILEQVLLQPKNQRTLVSPRLAITAKNKRNKYRKLWLAAASRKGVNHARQHKFGYVYAWLYRYDRSWLLQINTKLKLPHEIKNSRVNWHKRDRDLVKLLCNIRDETELRLDDPRHSANWYLSKLYQGSSVAKYLNNLPLCKLFFNKFCETIAEYQIRRITFAVIKQRLLMNELKRWQLLRMSGLSEQRLTALANVFLHKVVYV